MACMCKENHLIGWAEGSPIYRGGGKVFRASKACNWSNSELMNTRAPPTEALTLGGGSCWMPAACLGMLRDLSDTV